MDDHIGAAACHKWWLQCVTTHARKPAWWTHRELNNGCYRHKEKLGLIYRPPARGDPSQKTTQCTAISFIINLCFVQKISLSHCWNRFLKDDIITRRRHSILVLHAPEDDMIDRVKVIWFSQEVHCVEYLLDCAIDHFENDEEEKC